MNRIGDYFAVDSDWQRPVQPIGARDLWLSSLLAVASVVTIELSRGLDYFKGSETAWWWSWIAVIAGCALLVIRRRLPLLTAVLAALHMFVVGVTLPMVMGHISMQVVYFMAFYSAVAWARDRRAMVLVIGLIVLLLLSWVAWQFAVGNAVQSVLEEMGRSNSPGLLSPVTSSIILTFLINVAFFGGAAAMGQIAWLSARQRDRLASQAHTIAAQAKDLQQRAVVEERLRIARELHDVVAHHVSVIGIQAAAGRKVLNRDPEATAGALSAIETSSREAVTQMRDLLGTLRTDTGKNDSEAGSRAPHPGTYEISALVAEHATATVRTSYDVVEEPAGALERLPSPMALTLYRTTQEALANVSRHSTATEVHVVLRVRHGSGQGSGRGHAEVEVVDNGRPRPGTSGSGLGQLGIRERVASHRGEVEIGPRVAGGYRVRVRLPLSDEGDQG